jgi:general stress protein 26
MPNEVEIASKFWKALDSDQTVMLGLSGVDEGHAQPMTAQRDAAAQGGPIWFFSAKDVDLVEAMGERHRAVLSFASKGHDLFAFAHGELCREHDRSVVDRFWNRFVAAWYPGGKDDPNLQVLRFEPDRAQVWLNERSVFAGIKLLMGRDPKVEYRDKVAEIELR